MVVNKIVTNRLVGIEMIQLCMSAIARLVEFKLLPI